MIDFNRLNMQSRAHSMVMAMHKAGLNNAEIAARIGIKEGRIRPFLHGASALTDDEFRIVSEKLSLPVPFRSSTPKEAHG